MKVYIVISDDILNTQDCIQGVFENAEDAEIFWKEFKSDRFKYIIQEHEVII